MKLDPVTRNICRPNNGWQITAVYRETTLVKRHSIKTEWLNGQTIKVKPKSVGVPVYVRNQFCGSPLKRDVSEEKFHRNRTLAEVHTVQIRHAILFECICFVESLPSFNNLKKKSYTVNLRLEPQPKLEGSGTRSPPTLP